jgi:large subunit ribosomal protein L20
MAGLKKSGVAINRKALADLAVHDAAAFARLTSLAKDAVGARTTAA